jgi:flagellar biosynthesis GTPase FlhF
MSTQLTESELERRPAEPSLSGERHTYRGRDLAEILPRVRAELGADAVVVCQRDGLVGGIGGFFAKRFVEIEAIAGSARVDFYDDEDAMPDQAPMAADAFSEPDTLVHATVPVIAERLPQQRGPAAQPVTRRGLTQADVERNDAYANVARHTPVSVPANNATTDWGDLPGQSPLDGVIAVEQPWASESGHFERDGWFQGPQPQPAIDALQPVAHQDLDAFAAPFADDPEPFAAAPSFAGVGESPYVATANVSFADQLAAVELPEGEITGVPVFSDGDDVAAEDRRPSQQAPSAPTSAPVAPADAATHDAERLIVELTASGIGADRARALINAAAIHELPFTTGSETTTHDLRAALRSAIARSLPIHRALPQGGALIAIVGAGGAGKTRCAAALAAAYNAASTLVTRAVVLGRYDSGAELAGMLEPHGVAVQTAERGGRSAAQLASSRSGEFVVADTPTVTPGDAAAVGILAVELGALAPEDVLLALPATITAAAARRLVSSFMPVGITALIVTHADETDQFGVAAEISLETGLPIAFIHSGLELPGALQPADPVRIAAHLVP